MTADREDAAIAWARERLGVQQSDGFARATWCCNKTGEFEAVIVLSNFTPRNVDVHIAAEPAFWRKPRAVRWLFNEAFGYIFNQLGAARATGLIRGCNTTCRTFVERLGFKFEGYMRSAFEDDGLSIYGFLKNEYLAHRWCAS